MGSCRFIQHLFCLSHRQTRWTMLVDNVGLQIWLLGTSNSMTTLTFFFGVNRSSPETSSTADRRSYRALEQLHGSWCKQPLTSTMDEITRHQEALTFKPKQTTHSIPWNRTYRCMTKSTWSRTVRGHTRTTTLNMLFRGWYTKYERIH